MIILTKIPYFSLQHEINTLNTQSFKENANWLQMLTQLIEDHQDYKDPEALEVVTEWMAERDYLRLVLLVCVMSQRDVG